MRLPGLPDGFLIVAEPIDGLVLRVCRGGDEPYHPSQKRVKANMYFPGCHDLCRPKANVSLMAIRRLRAVLRYAGREVATAIVSGISMFADGCNKRVCYHEHRIWQDTGCFAMDWPCESCCSPFTSSAWFCSNGEETRLAANLVATTMSIRTSSRGSWFVITSRPGFPARPCPTRATITSTILRSPSVTGRLFSM